MASEGTQVDREGRMLRAPARWQVGDTVAAPLDFYRGEVLSEWVDYNRHMTEAAYLTAFGWASDALFSYIGDDDAYRSGGHSFYTVETHIAYLREAAEHAPLKITTRVLGVDRKRLHIYHEMFGDGDKMLATTEQMLVHVDVNAALSVAILPEVRAVLDAIAIAHSTLAPADRAGHFALSNTE
ncbi:MAG: thioesterase family protein [Ilumatobacteraceae bacterium]